MRKRRKDPEQTGHLSERKQTKRRISIMRKETLKEREKTILKLAKKVFAMLTRRINSYPVFIRRRIRTVYAAMAACPVVALLTVWSETLRPIAFFSLALILGLWLSLEKYSKNASDYLVFTGTVQKKGFLNKTFNGILVRREISLKIPDLSEPVTFFIVNNRFLTPAVGKTYTFVFFAGKTNEPEKNNFIYFYPEEESVDKNQQENIAEEGADKKQDSNNNQQEETTEENNRENNREK